MTKDCPYRNNCNGVDCNKDFCMKKYRLDALYDASLLTSAQREYKKLYIDSDGTDLEQFQQLAAIEKDIVNFVQSGRNLYLHSTNCGNGKTSWSLRLVQAYFNKIWARSDSTCHALFINMPRFFLALKDNISAKNSYISYIKENILKADIVVWDDISHHVSTDYEITNLLSLIDTRIAYGKANIYTSNCPPQALASCLETRLASRISNLSTVIMLQGSDKRTLSQNQF